METIKIVINKEFIINKTIYENSTAETVVYEARDIMLQRTVILKSIRFHNEESKKAILREVSNQVLVEKHSDFVPKVYNVCVDNRASKVWIEMQQISGKSLRTIMDESGKGEKGKQWYDDTYNLFCDICKSMSYVHKVEKFVHKDLKPENIIVNRPRKCVYIIDFGISGPWMSKGIGTEKYMAPEQRSQVDKYQVTQATDIFALGQIMYEFLTGKTLVYGKELLYNPMGNDWLKMIGIEELNNPYYPCLVEIVKKCMEMSPAKRFGSADRLFSELQKNRANNKQSNRSPAVVKYIKE